MLDIVRFRKWFYLLTIVLVLVTIGALLAPPRLPWGLEFSSGTSLTVEFDELSDEVTSEEVRDRLLALGLEGAVVQRTGDNGFFIRTPVVEDDLLPFLEERLGPVEISDFHGTRDVADVIAFIDPVPEEALRAQFGEEVQGLLTGKADGGSILISAPDISEDRLQEILGSYRELFGPLETTAFDSAEDMALTLDFGPAVPQEDFRAELERIGEEFELTSPDVNQYVVAATAVSSEAREALIPALEERFGRARRITFQNPADLAVRITSDEPIDIEELRNEIQFQGFSHVAALPAGENSSLLLGESVPQERQDELLSALRDRFGSVRQDPFDFAAGLAVRLEFGEVVELASLQTEITRLESGAIAVSKGEQGVFIVGKDIPSERQDALVSSLEERFGLAVREPFDFSQGIALTVRFTDPVQLDDVIESLAILSIQEVLDGRASAQLVGPNTFHIVGADVSPEAQESILMALEERLGSQEQSRLDQEDDLAVVLDFGEEVGLFALRAEITEELEKGALVEVMDTGAFFVVGIDITGDRQEALLEAVERRFGPARRSSFDSPEDMALVLTFEPPVAIGEVRAAVSEQGLVGVALAEVESGSFFVGVKDISEQHREALTEAFEELADTVESTPFDFAAGTAMSLDFGERVDEEQLRSAVAELGFEDVSVLPAETEGHFVGGHRISASRQEELLSGLEERFGLARRTPFDSAENMAVTLVLMDRERVAEVVDESLIVQKMGPSSFFLAGSDLSVPAQAQIFSTLEAAFGTVARSDFNASRDVAVIMSFSQPVTETAVSQALTDFGYSAPALLQRGENSYFLRSERPSSDQKGKIVQNLEAAFGPVDPNSLEFSFVDAEIARRSIVNTFIAVLAGTGGILLYVWWAFRRAPRPFRFGVAAVVPLVHDAAMVLGGFGLMAKFRGVEIDSLMVIGLLAVIGYSVNNTIVVLDRIRENVARNPGRDFDTAVNVSLNETLTRNLNTSLTTGVAILAVLLFGGATIFNFMLVLLIGVWAGTYSSLFLAGNILVSWEKGEIPRLRLPFLRRRDVAYR